MAKYATITSGIWNLVSGLVSSGGVGDAGKLVQTDSGGRLDPSLMPTGVLSQVKILPASEDLSGGDFVNIWDDEGTAKARLADGSTTGKEAHGFVKAAALSGANATIYFEGQNDQVSGVTGGKVWLSTSTPGGFTQTPPTGDGKTCQLIGTGVSATAIDFEAQMPITL